MRWLAPVGLRILLLLLTPNCGPVLGSQPTTRELDLPDSPEELPYKLRHSGRAGQRHSNLIVACPDLNGDSISETLYSFSDPIGQCAFRDVVLGYNDPLGAMCYFQYNGPYRSAFPWFTDFLDVMGSGGDEIILTKHCADTVLFEIVSFDSSLSRDTTVIVPAAIGDGLKPNETWHAIHAQPLAAYDVNGDGVRDLIYSRSAKPDSAFERGIVAYDLANSRQLWLFKTADNVGRISFSLFRRSEDSVCFVFTTSASQNAYESNGMDSYHSYIVSITPDGRELWRKTLSSGFGGFACEPLDANGDGRDEVCACAARSPDAGATTYSIQCFDPFTGDMIAESEQLPYPVSRFKRWKRSDNPPEYCIILSQLRGTGQRLCRLDEHLRTMDDIVGVADFGPDGADANGDGLPDVFVKTVGGRSAVLDAASLVPLAFTQSQGDFLVYRGESRDRLLIVDADGFYGVFDFDRQPLMTMLYARYKWFLAIVLSAILAMLVYRAGRWTYGLYLASAGLPTLQSINAAVVVLNRRGKVSYFNQNPLVASLFGVRIGRSMHYSKVGDQRLTDSIRRSYSDPYAPVQERRSLEKNGTKTKIDLTIVPRVDSRNRFLGKIIMAEDVTGKAGFERKVVFGEAAQRWLHKLKGAMATAKIRLDNILEDPRSGAVVGANEALSRSLHSIKGQLEDTAITADKILGFCAIAKPELVRCDLNAIVSSAMRPFVESPPRGVTVAEKLQQGLPTVLIDLEQITEVVENLLSNAVNAIAETGTVTVSTRSATNLLSSTSSRVVEIVISDTGSGISDDDLPRIFDPGFTRSKNGTGVGLAIVKEIVENHNGSILVESKKGEGSRFTVRLPAARESDGNRF